VYDRDMGKNLFPSSGKGLYF